MTTAATDVMLAELNAAINQLTPQIQGHIGLTEVSFLSEQSKAVVREELATDKRRMSLLVVARDSLNSLNVDDYPQDPKTEVPSEIYAQLQSELNAITIAIGEFVPQPPAISATVDLGQPIPKP